MLQKVKDIYSESIQIQISASSLLSENIATAAQMVMQCLLSGNKVIACGVSRSYANAQFLVSNLLNRYDFERPFPHANIKPAIVKMIPKKIQVKFMVFFSFH